MNEHIHQYCLDYIKTKTKPEFGILIKGSWGCGH
jgi:hypothetical protein